MTIASEVIRDSGGLPSLCGWLVIAAMVASVPMFATHAACVGDCDGSGDVTVDEVLTGVNIALGSLPLTECAFFDRDDNGATSGVLATVRSPYLSTTSRPASYSSSRSSATVDVNGLNAPFSVAASLFAACRGTGYCAKG